MDVEDDVGKVLKFCVGVVVIRRARCTEGSGVGCGHCVGVAVEEDEGRRDGGAAGNGGDTTGGADDNEDGAPIGVIGLSLATGEA